MGSQLQELGSSVGDLTKNNQNRIVLDMSKVTYVDSSAIGVIVSCHLGVRSAGGQLRVAGVGERVLSVFRMVGIDRVLALDPTLDAAVAALCNP